MQTTSGAIRATTGSCAAGGVPPEKLVGEKSKGVAYAKLLLGKERTSIARVGQSKERHRRIKELAGQVESGGKPVIEDQKFREEMREFFTTKFPQEIRDAVRDGHELSQEQIVESMQALNAAGLAVPHWPVESAGQDRTALQRHLWHEAGQAAFVPQPPPLTPARRRPLPLAQ